ncbi:related to TIM barrel metal-dependent hydrolase [Phialocephala subalpina]|uniref:Related to TIM barrel metal-dependent hydrolase n=1 Tax=Phialocephala subalpina TaxID=576137 RepID=A0A1L7WMQ9_9HELO|nr:related to TIM barrel metal-dependent hydrolase [Phialocephala subalpina]
MLGFMFNMISTFFASFLRRYFDRVPKVSWSQRSKQPSLEFEPPKTIPSRSFLSKIPSNSWDSHMHVIDPQGFPLSQDAQYVPKTHLLSSALAFEKTVSVRNIVLVQPSIYGYDNSCLLSALCRLGPSRARGIVTLDPKKMCVKTLEEWHEMGVRGVRVNLQSVGRTMEKGELEEALRKYADVIRPFGWVLQLYVPLGTVTELERIIPTLGIRVVFDHFGHPALPPVSEEEKGRGFDPYLLPGFASLVKLLEEGSTYVKMSAPYRISKSAGYQDLEPFAKELLRVAGKKRVVFATDWPHTRFEGLDIKPFVKQVTGWCEGDEVLIERVFKGNAEDLWGVVR